MVASILIFVIPGITLSILMKTFTAKDYFCFLNFYYGFKIGFKSTGEILMASNTQPAPTNQGIRIVFWSFAVLSFSPVIS
jgi:hypothetical protein